MVRFQSQSQKHPNIQAFPPHLVRIECRTNAKHAMSFLCYSESTDDFQNRSSAHGTFSTVPHQLGGTFQTGTHMATSVQKRVNNFVTAHATQSPLHRNPLGTIYSLIRHFPIIHPLKSTSQFLSHSSLQFQKQSPGSNGSPLWILSMPQSSLQYDWGTFLLPSLSL